MDLQAMTDVELTELWLSKISGYPEAMGQISRIDEEAHLRGRERMAAAFRVVGEKRGAGRVEVAP